MTLQAMLTPVEMLIIIQAAAVQNAGKPVVVLPNYTSMLTVRDKLSALAGGGRFWE